MQTGRTIGVALSVLASACTFGSGASTTTDTGTSGPGVDRGMTSAADGTNSDPAPTSGAGTSTGLDPSEGANTTTGEVPDTEGPPDPATSSSGGSPPASSEVGDGSTSEGDPCVHNVVLAAYWPPSNEMMRPWSTDPVQNPGGWIGENWEGYGFDVHAFFPEFPPDGNPLNDAMGTPGWAGDLASDLRVDYQDTSVDFWSIVDTLQPAIVLTFARANDGQPTWGIRQAHGGNTGGGGNPAGDWGDDGSAPGLPTQGSIDPRSWQAISIYRNGVTLPSGLPLNQLLANTSALGLGDVQLTFAPPPNTTGFLAGYLGLHAAYYAATAPFSVVAGELDVGPQVSNGNARLLLEESLRTVLAANPVESFGCRP